MARFSVGGDENGEGSSAKRFKTADFCHSQEVVEEEDEESEDEEIEDEESEDEEIEEEESAEEDVEEDCIEESTAVHDPILAPVTGGETRVFNCVPISVTLTDPDVLDCDICCEPLKIPVFQCENGHIACSVCCSRLSNKCPSCSLPIGYNRCRAIEKVLEAVKVSCPNATYGCSETIRYSDKYLHEKKCTFAPCMCPLEDCSFINSSQQLYDHFKRVHTRTATGFHYGVKFTLILSTQSRSLFLQEESHGTLFILHNDRTEIGNTFSVSCILPSCSPKKFPYDLSVKNQVGTLRFECIAKNTQALASNQPLSPDYLLIPSGFYSRTTELVMAVCIWPETRVVSRNSSPVGRTSSPVGRTSSQVGRTSSQVGRTNSRWDGTANWKFRR